MKTAEPLVIEDVALYEDDAEIAAEIRARGLTAYVVMPLTVGGQVSGVFELEVTDGPRTVDPEKFELATIIANQAAIAVLNANLLEQTLVRTRELETLLEAAQATSYTLDIDEVFASIVRLAMQALDMDDCVIMIYDNVEEELRVELDLNRDDDPSRITPPGTVYDLRDYPAKSRALHEEQIIVAAPRRPDRRPQRGRGDAGKRRTGADAGAADRARPVDWAAANRTALADASLHLPRNSNGAGAGRAGGDGD